MSTRTALARPLALLARLGVSAAALARPLALLGVKPTSLARSLAALARPLALLGVNPRVLRGVRGGPLAGLALGLLLLLAPGTAAAHALDPVLVDVRLSAGLDEATVELELEWSRSRALEAALGADAALARPVLPAGCAARGEPRRVARGTTVAWQWRARCPAAVSAGELELAGVAPPDNDVLVRLRDPRSHAVTHTALLDARRRFALEPAGASEAGAPAARGALASYLVLGVEHILLGPDHLLFVACLVLLLAGRLRRLPWTLTAFTLAHSLTLALAMLDVLRLAGPPVEAAIALSIVALAAELVRPAPRDASLFARRPAAMAFAFGLLHGLGFAGALGEVGVPAEARATALLGFNLGVELGQLAFVLAWLAAAWLARRAWRAAARRAERHGAIDGAPAGALGRGVLVYGIGAVAAYWLIERVAAF